MNNKIKLLIFTLLIVFISFKYTDFARSYIVGFNTYILSKYMGIRELIKNKIEEHLSQQESIIQLRKENKRLRKTALLSIAFAGKLDDIFKMNGMDEYRPDVQMVQALAYSDLNNYNRIWLDFKDFNKSKIYGLMYNGYSAGIVVEKNLHPLGLLLRDPKSIFSVYVGNNKIPGVIEGDGKKIVVKYIPLWMNPKIGDEVITSGLDGIFFKGVRVGKVIGVIEEELSKTVEVEPYVKVNIPSFLYVVTKE